MQERAERAVGGGSASHSVLNGSVNPVPRRLSRMRGAARGDAERCV
jgi:hypothetical protein